MSKFQLCILTILFISASCNSSINTEAKELVTNFMEAYKAPMKRGEMSQYYKSFLFKNIYLVSEYEIINFKNVSNDKINVNIETKVSGEAKSLRLILEKENDIWKITDSKGISNMVTSYAKEFGFGIKAGCFTKNIETLTDQQFLGKIKRSNTLLAQLAQKESVLIASKLVVENLNWEPGKDQLSGGFNNQTDYNFREVGYLVKYYDQEKNEIGMHNDIINAVNRGDPFTANQSTPFSNKLPKSIPVQTKNIDIQFFINPNEITDHLVTKPFSGKECSRIQ